MRDILAGICIALLAVGCGSEGLSLTEYVERLNRLIAETTVEMEIALADFAEQPSPTPDDVLTLLNREVELRAELQDRLEALNPPDQIATLHMLLLEAHGRIATASASLPGRAESAASREDYEQSAEFEAYRVANVAGIEACQAMQVQLDATRERGVFAETPWVPDEMKEIVNAALGCDSTIGD